MSETRAASAARDSSRTVAAGLLAWVWPGLGHLFLGRRGKGLVLMGSILALFGLGVAMDSRLQLHLGLEDPLALLFSLAQMGVGAPYVLARLLGVRGGARDVPDLRVRQHLHRGGGAAQHPGHPRRARHRAGSARASDALAPRHALVFSALVSTVFATLLRDTTRERLRFGLLAFAAFVLSTLVIGWLTNPFPR